MNNENYQEIDCLEQLLHVISNPELFRLAYKPTGKIIFATAEYFKRKSIYELESCIRQKQIYFQEKI